MSVELTADVAAVVPTLGAPTLGAALASLRRQGGAVEVTVVHQGATPLPEEVAGLADRVLTFAAPLGYAAAANAGIAVRRRRHLLLLNDDAELLPGWLAAAFEALEAAPTVAAVQGVNLAPEPKAREHVGRQGPDHRPLPVNLGTEPAAAGPASPDARVEGCGIGWNRWWQAVQLGAGAGPPALDEAREVFGASAAAALFRTSALAVVALPGGVFDPRLDTYYEDVDLAGRLRAAGFQAAVATSARARHLGGGSAAALGRRRLALLYGNRWLVLTRLLGRALAGRLPRIFLRDLADAARRPACSRAVLAGWARATRLRSSFAHSGPPLVPLAELRRLSAENWLGTRPSLGTETLL